MSRGSVRLLTDNRAEELFLRAIFGPRVEGGEIEVKSYLLSDAAIAVAHQSLLEHPERPVALVLNANTEDPEVVSENRASIERILSSASPDGWCVALAVPNLGAWASADPRIKNAFNSDESTRGNYYDQAARMHDLVKGTLFDLDALHKASPDFRGLEQFLDRSVPTTGTATKSVRGRS